MSAPMNSHFLTMFSTAYLRPEQPSIEKPHSLDWYLGLTAGASGSMFPTLTICSDGVRVAVASGEISEVIIENYGGQPYIWYNSSLAPKRLGEDVKRYLEGMTYVEETA